MSKFKSLSKLARLGLAVMAVTTITVWAQIPVVIPITSAEDLQKIGTGPDFPPGAHYILENDITIESEWTPIGRWSVDQGEIPVCDVPCPDAAIEILYEGAFKGTFNGNGHTIRGLRTNIDAAELIEVDDWLPSTPAILAAGLFGALDGAQISNLNIEADVVDIKGSYEIGAGILAGFSRNSTITDVRVTGTVRAISVSAYAPTGAIAGGLVGKATGGTITNSSSEVSVRSISYSLFPTVVPVRNGNMIGGLAGVIENVTINGSHATVILNGDGVSAGGLVGENLGGRITRSSAKMSGGMTAGMLFIDFLNVGGLVGINNHFIPVVICLPEVCDPPMPIIGEITQSYSEVNLVIGGSSGRVPSPANIGGLAGNLVEGMIENSYSIGSLTINNDVGIFNLGGLAGSMGNGCSGDILNSYSAVALNAPANRTSEQLAGGLVGAIRNVCLRIFVHNSYWDVEVSGVSLSDGGHGKATDEMMSQSTFANWDFTNVWRIDEDESYPYLAWQGGTVSISRDITSRGINKNNLAPTATIRGKTLNVRTSSPANLQVRLIDMRGRTMVRFITEGNGGSFSLNKVSAGRYLVEMRDVSNGRRFTSSVVVR